MISDGPVSFSVNPQEDISEALKKAGLPEVQKTLGSRFVFSSMYDMESVVLAGTITAVHLSNHRVDLYLSTPKFARSTLDHLTHNKDDVWTAHVVVGERFSERFSGRFKLIP